MALREELWPRSEPPQDAPGLDPGHWLTPWVRQGVIAGPTRNATSSNRYTAASAVQKGADSNPGIIHELTGSGGYITAPTVADASAWTFVSYGIPRSLTTSSVATVAESPGSGTVDRSLAYGASGAVSAYIYDGANRIATTTKAMTAGRPALIAAVSTGSSIGAYVDGELTTTSASNSGYTAYTTPELVFGYGFMSGSTQASTWSAYYTLLIRRALTVAELWSLTQAPWEILEPRRIWVPVSAGGGSVSLIVADATHAHAADGLALTSSTALSVAEATHAHAADAITLVVGSVLTVAEASHVHAADSLTLTAASALAVADATHSHAADNITLSVAGATNLTVADALHGHAADALALTSAHALIVADATHSHTVDGLTLTAASALAVADATHAHAADNITLSVAGATNLTVADALHGHAADNLTLELSDGITLTLSDALHAHTADGVLLTVSAYLVVSDALHAHAADNILLSLPGAFRAGNPRVWVLDSRQRHTLVDSRLRVVHLH